MELDSLLMTGLLVTTKKRGNPTSESENFLAMGFEVLDVMEDLWSGSACTPGETHGSNLIDHNREGVADALTTMKMRLYRPDLENQ